MRREAELRNLSRALPVSIRDAILDSWRLGAGRLHYAGWLYGPELRFRRRHYALFHHSWALLPDPVHALYPGILLQLPRAAACAGRLPVDVYLQEELWLPLTLRFCSYPGLIASRCLAANQVKGTELLYYLVMFVIGFCFEDTSNISCRRGGAVSFSSRSQTKRFVQLIRQNVACDYAIGLNT
jgi:hypothetical protein